MGSILGGSDPECGCVECVGGRSETIERLAAELAKANEIIAKLPKCWRLNDEGELVQDVPVVPGVECWFWNGFSDCLIEGPEEIISIQLDYGDERTVNDDCEPSWFYDSREAAEVGLSQVKIGGEA